MAKTSVRAHQSRSKTGKVFSVRESQRDVKGAKKPKKASAKKVVAGLAAELLAEAKAAGSKAKAPADVKTRTKPGHAKASKVMVKQAPKATGKAATRRTSGSKEAKAPAKVAAKTVAKTPAKPSKSAAAPRSIREAIRGTKPAVKAPKVAAPKVAAPKGKRQAGSPNAKPKGAVATPKAGKQVKHAVRGTTEKQLKGTTSRKPAAIATRSQATPVDAPKKGPALKVMSKTPATSKQTIAHPMTGKPERQPLAKLTPNEGPKLVLVTKPEKRRPLASLPVNIMKPPAGGEAPEAEAARAKRGAIFSQHLTRIAEKRSLERKLFEAKTPEQKAKLKERLKDYKGYTNEVAYRVQEAALANMDPMLRGIAGDWMRKLGMTPFYDENGRPAANTMFADMAQHARESAWKVIRRHDPTRHKTALHDQVRGTVEQELSRKWRQIMSISPVRVSVEDNAAMTRLSKVRAELSTKLGRDPNENEVAEAANMESAQVKRLTQMAHQIVAAHLDAMSSSHDGEGEGGGTLGDTIADTGASPDQAAVEGDHHDRLRQLVHRAIASIPDARARYALVTRHEIEDGGAALRDLVAREQIPQLAAKLNEVRSKTPKQLKEWMDKNNIRSLSDATTIKYALTALGARADRIVPTSQRYKLAANLLKWNGDYHAMLTTPKDTKDVPGGKKAWIAVSDIFERLGYDSSTGRQMLSNAKKHLQLRSELQRFHSDDVEKGLTVMSAWTPEVLLYRHLFEGAPEKPEFDRIVKMWEPDLALIKSFRETDNVYTVVDPANSLVFQMAVYGANLAALDEYLVKGIGAEMAAKHPGGHWVTMHGRHVYIDKAGIIQSGPQQFVGQHIDKLSAHLKAGGEMGDHSHEDADSDEDAKKTNVHRIEHGGKVAYLHLQHTYDHENKKNKHNVEVSKITDENGNAITTGEGKKAKPINKFPDVMRHFGFEPGAKDAEGRPLITPAFPLDFRQAAKEVASGKSDMSTEFGKIVSKYKNQIDNKLAEGKSGYSTIGKKEHKEAAKASKKDVDFAHTEVTPDGGKVFSATMHDGHVVHIHVDKDGRVKDHFWGALLGNTLVQSADDLNAKLKAIAGSTSTVHLSNGKNHWLVNVQYDHKGAPVITSGPLAGKRLHEVMNESGGLRSHQGPIEHNGKKLYAGYDSKQGRMTALGNWSEQKAFEYFDAHTPEEKEAVRAKLAAADAAANPEVASIEMEPGETAAEKKDREKRNKEARKQGLAEEEAPEQNAILKLPNSEEEMGLAEKLVEGGYGLNRGALSQEQIAKIAQDHGLGAVPKTGPTAEQERLVRAAHRVAQVMQQLKDDGHGAMKRGKDGKLGLSLPVSSVDRIAHLLGTVKLKDNVMPKMQLHRQQQAAIAESINRFDEGGSDQYGAEGTAGTVVPGLKPGIRMTKHQQKMVHHYVQTGRTISALGVGNGKTLAALSAAEVAKANNPNAPKKHLVIVPTNAQANAWKKDGADFFGHDEKTMSFGRDISPDAQYHVVTKSMLANKNTKVGGKHLGDLLRSEGLEKDDLHRPEVQDMLHEKHGVASHEYLKDGQMVSLNTKVGGKSLAAHLKEQGFDGVIIDEAHTLNKSGLKHGVQRQVVDAYVHGLDHHEFGLKGSHGKAKGVMALTGTPIQNHLGEQYNLVNLTHRGQHDLGDEKRFISNYGVKDEATGQLIGIHPDKAGELGDKLARYMVTSTHEDLNEEKRPPQSQVQDVPVPLGGEHHDKLAQKLGYASVDQMLKDHHAAIHSSGASRKIDSDVVGTDAELRAREAAEAPKEVSKRAQAIAGKGALAAISNAETDLHSFKAQAVEDRVREILRNDPSAKLILASKRKEGQDLLHSVVSKVLGEVNRGGAAAHMEKALADVKQQMRDAETAHHDLRERLEAEHAISKQDAARHEQLRAKIARGEEHTPEEAAEYEQTAKGARAHADLADRLAQFSPTSPAWDKLKDVHDDLVQKVGGSDAARAGYKTGNDILRITADKDEERIANSDDEDFDPLAHLDENDDSDEARKRRNLSAKERQEAIGKFNNDESHKAIVISTNIAASGVSLGRGTHLLDLDGDFNPSTLEQLYARHARLTGSVPQAMVHRFVTSSETAGVASLDERKRNAATRKSGVSQAVREAARTGKIETSDVSHPRVTPKAMGRAGQAPKGRTDGAPEPDME